MREARLQSSRELDAAVKEEVRGMESRVQAYGHKAGDKVLKALAQTLQDNRITWPATAARPTS